VATLRFVTLPSLRPTLAFVLVIALLNVVTQVDHVDDRDGALALEPPAFALHRWRAETGLVSHLAYVERFPARGRSCSIPIIRPSLTGNGGLRRAVGGRCTRPVRAGAAVRLLLRTTASARNRAAC
jgi:hypothetical protein